MEGHTNHFGRLILPSRETFRKCIVNSIDPRPLLSNLLQKFFVEIAQGEQRLDHLRVSFRPRCRDDHSDARGDVLDQRITEDLQRRPCRGVGESVGRKRYGGLGKEKEKLVELIN